MSKRLFACAPSLALLLVPVVDSIHVQSLPQSQLVAVAAQTPAKTNLPETLTGVPGASDDWWSVVLKYICVVRGAKV